MITVELLIPVADNDGQTFSPNHDDDFLQTVATLFGGATIVPGLTTGRWIDGGTVYRDQCRILEFDVEGMILRADDIRAVAEFAKSHYGQLAVRISYLGCSEVI